MGSHSEIFQVLNSPIISTSNGQKGGMGEEGRDGRGEPHLRWDVGSEVSSLACSVRRGARRAGAVSETTSPPEGHRWLVASRERSQSHGWVSGWAFYNGLTWAAVFRAAIHKAPGSHREEPNSHL